MFAERKKNKYAVWPVEVEMDTALGRGNGYLTDGCFLFLFFAFIRFKEEKREKKKKEKKKKEKKKKKEREKKRSFYRSVYRKEKRINMAFGGRVGYCTRQG